MHLVCQSALEQALDPVLCRITVRLLLLANALGELAEQEVQELVRVLMLRPDKHRCVDELAPRVANARGPHAHGSARRLLRRTLAAVVCPSSHGCLG